MVVEVPSFDFASTRTGVLLRHKRLTYVTCVYESVCCLGMIKYSMNPKQANGVVWCVREIIFRSIYAYH